MTTTTLSSEIAKESLNLRAYGGEIENVKLLTPLTSDTPIEELRRRYREDGVIWIKDIIDRDLVNKCRREYLSFY
ncbi:uncharacterized protein KD926_002585 [Aspergillus affinis]|uniref:uncharacterized protein n=1 Tax=Aspergillus affinis TaxID=1070780 RepID=UPI0022FDD875|nr:uncharacterized protein KD926_002585 [Aspergillus affinis]KAI9035973.1 hypothetical protein KD926_002585 [Aspergillus affinis]